MHGPRGRPKFTADCIQPDASGDDAVRAKSDIDQPPHHRRPLKTPNSAIVHGTTVADYRPVEALRYPLLNLRSRLNTGLRILHKKNQ